MQTTPSPITIDPTRCNGCGACLPVCHESAMKLNAGTLSIDLALCSTCSQCIAVCPQRALSWRGTASSTRTTEQLPSVAQLDELLKERRSMRRFRPDPIAREVLEEIAAAAAYAPTNNYDFRLVIVDDPVLLRDLEVYTHAIVSGLYRLVFKYPLITSVLTSLPFAPHTGPKDQVKVEGTVARRHAIFHEAPAMMFVVGDRRVALSSDSAQYALANVVFAAQVRGIGSCLSGAGKTMLTKHPRARRALGLKRHERVYGVLTLGYPAVDFKNNVEGKRLPITWL